MSWFVPGRLEVLGKHTDYAGGRSLLAAVDRGIRVDIKAAMVGITVSTDAAADSITLDTGAPNPAPAGHWSHYLTTVIERLTANFGQLSPCTISITSDLPLASGMSSSSALIVATALALADYNGFPRSSSWTTNIANRTDLAGYLACVENGMSFGTLAGHRGVGTFGGSEDHTAMLCCEPGLLSQVRFCPIAVEEVVPFGDDWSFVVAVSGVRAEKTGAAKELYNRAALRTRELVEIWNGATGQKIETLAGVIDHSPDAFSRLDSLVMNDNELRLRLKAFVTESNVIIPAASAALRSGDYAGFGDLATQSHANASLMLGNQVQETDRLVELAMEMGAQGATGFGAGFGGSVWALVQKTDAADFATTWLRRYLTEYPQHSSLASTIVTTPSAAARPL